MTETKCYMEYPCKPNQSIPPLRVPNLNPYPKKPLLPIADEASKVYFLVDMK